MKAVPCLAGTSLVTVLDPGLGLGVSPVPAVSGVVLEWATKKFITLKKQQSANRYFDTVGWVL